MDIRFKDVKVIAWDLDTTLYRPIPELGEKFKEECIKEVANHKKIPLNEALILFEETRSHYDSSTMTLEALGVGDFSLVNNIQQRINKIGYLSKDEKLIKLFGKLKKFRHFIISNSVHEEIKATLQVLGLSDKLFEKIFSVEDTGRPKPDASLFRLLLSYTHLPPEAHLYVGDRERVDIEPAQKIGFKTILVWGESTLPTVSVPTVYEVAELLL